MPALIRVQPLVDLVLRLRWLIPLAVLVPFNLGLRWWFTLRGPVRLHWEVLLLAYIGYLAHALQRPGLFAPLWLTLILLGFYVINFAKYLFLGDPVLVSDIRDIPEFLSILSWGWAALIVAAVALGPLVLLLTIDPRKLPRGLVIALPLVLLLCAANLTPRPVVEGMDAILHSREWNKGSNFYVNGSIFSLVRETAFQKVSLQELHSGGRPVAPDLPFQSPDALLAALEERRNVHVVLLESYVDPESFRALHFHPAPYADQFLAWREAGGSLSLSPAFGGGTANAEFEILCGVPALEIGGHVAFNSLEGAPIPCLPNLLARAGYATVAISPIDPQFFNVRAAYRSVGFQRSIFEDEFDMSDLDGRWLSNESALAQALDVIRGYVAEGTPVFDYVVTTAGHTPFALNEERRPLVVEVAGAEDGSVPAVVNHSYYTSRALVDFERGLRAIDPDGILAIIGDHLPPLGSEYGETDYLGLASDEKQLHLKGTLLLVFDRGETQHVGPIAHYMLPEVIGNLLTDGAYCRAHDCLSEREVIARPPHFANRADPIHFDCQGEAARRPDCEGASALRERFTAAYRSMLLLSSPSEGG